MRNVGLYLKVLGGVIILIFAYSIYQLILGPDDSYRFNQSSETVIKQIKSLNRLETAVYTIEKIIDVETNGSKFRQFLFGDRILLIAHGQIIAGFDLQNLSENDIRVDGRILKINLPAPEILIAKLNSDQTRVYDRQQGLLTKGDSNLESEARAEAEKVIKDAACAGGILDEASKNAKSQLISLFQGAGFDEVIVEIPKGTC